jgi:arylsulfatase A-like enzyme
MKIIVLEACGLHLGYLGCYGNDWVATPNLDRMAAEGVVFDWHFADQPELTPTTPWHERSVGTGCYAFPGQPPIAQPIAVGPRVERCLSLQSFARDALQAVDRNERWLWIEGPSLLPPWHLDDELLDAYFDEDDVEEGLAPWPDPQLGLVNLNAADVLQLQNTYAAAVTVYDAQLGMLLDRLRERNGLDDILLCVTARSGLPLGEHGMIGVPEPRLHDQLVHVPLLMRFPGAAEAGARIAALTQSVDLLPTCLETLASAVPALHGRTLWPLIRGTATELRPYAVAGLRVHDKESRMLRTLNRALHVAIGDVGRTPQFFVKPEDRWEVNDLYQQQMESADALATALAAFADAVGRPGPLDYPMPDTGV